VALTRELVPTVTAELWGICMGTLQLSALPNSIIVQIETGPGKYSVKTPPFSELTSSYNTLS